MILGRLLKSSTEIFQSPMLFLNKSVFSNFSCFFLNPRKCSNLNYNCSNLLDMRDHQEQVKKAFCYQKIFRPFTVWINCSNDLKNWKFSANSLELQKFFSITRTIFSQSRSKKIWKTKDNYLFIRPHAQSWIYESANSFLWNFYGSVISGCVSSNPNLKSYLMHRFTIEMTDDLTSFLSNANTVILVDQMSVSTGEIKCLKSAFAVKKPLQTSRRWPKKRKKSLLEIQVYEERNVHNYSIVVKARDAQFCV